MISIDQLFFLKKFYDIEIYKNIGCTKYNIDYNVIEQYFSHKIVKEFM